MGKEATYVVRADCLVIGEGGNGFENKATGTLQGEEHVGNIVTYVLALENGQVFKVEMHERATRGWNPQFGEKLGVAWKTEDARLLL